MSSVLALILTAATAWASLALARTGAPAVGVERMPGAAATDSAA